MSETVYGSVLKHRQINQCSAQTSGKGERVDLLGRMRLDSSERSQALRNWAEPKESVNAPISLVGL